MRETGSERYGEGATCGVRWMKRDSGPDQWAEAETEEEREEREGERRILLCC